MPLNANSIVKLDTRRPSKDEYFLHMLELVAARSTCIRRTVGAIITDADGIVLATGYNGTPRGFTHCIDRICKGGQDAAGDTSRCMAVHAEQNAIIQCTDLRRAHTIYVSCSPCFVCAKMIANTSIKRVVCVTEYPDRHDVLATANIELVYMRDMLK